MSTYPWRRFWVKRGSVLHTDYRQFPAYYPSGSVYFDQNAFQLSELEELPLLILLGEPGIGKSVVIEQAFANNKSSFRIYSRLSKYTSAKDIVEEWERDQTFRQWQLSAEPLFLYIDGLDEGILYTTTIGAYLLEWLEGQPVDRIYLRITCRTAVWEKVLEEGFAALYKKVLPADKPLVYELGPLSQQDVSTAARQEGIEPEAFLLAVAKRELSGMASKPITLSFLLNLFKEGTLLQEQLGKADIYLKGCLQLCTENSKTRRMARKAGSLTKENRLRLASRLAAYSVFANKPFLAKEDTQSGTPGDFISPDEVIPDSFQLADRTEMMDLAAYNEVLDTGLFVAVGEELLGWSHRTFAEFLAAWHVHYIQLPLFQLQQLFLSTADQEEKVIPQLEETAAWLASLHRDFFALLLQKQPLILLRTDGPILSEDNRWQLIESLLEKAETGQIHPFRDQERYYSKLKHERLAEQLITTLINRTKSVTSRCLAAEIGQACVCNQLAETLVQIITDPAEDIWLRREAMNALEQLPELIGFLPKLVHLVLAPLPEDHNDEFKAALLRLLFPKHLTTQQLLTVLTKPKDDRLIGQYKVFLNNLDEKVPDESVAAMLSFLAEFDEVYNRYEPSEFDRLLQGMIKRAWQLVEQHAVLDNLTQIILRMFKNHQTFFVPDNEDRKRRLVAWQVLLRMDGDRLYLLRLARSYPGEPNTLVNQSDWEWLTESLVTTEDAVLRTRIAQLLGQLYTKDNTNWTDQVIILAERCPEMQQAFASWLETVDLDSPRGIHLIKNYLEEREWRERAERGERKYKLNYSPLAEAQNKLQQFTLGDNEAWWRMLHYLSIEETDRGAYTVESIQPDIRQYPLWPQLTREEQGQLVATGKEYLGRLLASGSVGTDISNRPIMAGYKVLLLLWATEPDWVKRIVAPYWALWAPLVVKAAIRADHIFAEAIEVVTVAYQNASEVFMSSFTKVVADYLPAEKGQLHLKNLGQQVDEALLLRLLNQVDGPEVLLKNKLEVLHYLLERHFLPACGYVWQQFQLYLSSHSESAENFGLACGALLVEYCAQFNWAEVWPSLTSHLAIGKKVFLRAAAQMRRELPDVLGEALSEQQLGELLLWLYRTFPPEEDTKHKGAYTPEPRDN